jgi:hypothetical protein
MLLLVGFIAKISILWVIGVVLLALGVILALIGMMGRAVATDGRSKLGAGRRGRAHDTAQASVGRKSAEARTSLPGLAA